MTNKTLAAAVIAIGTTFAGAAQADCFVTNSERRGLFGEQRHTRQFSGDSATTIWERYCKPFIQRTVQQENIQNGRFGMHCTGRVSCNVDGEIRGGRVQAPRTLSLGN